MYYLHTSVHIEHTYYVSDPCCGAKGAGHEGDMQLDPPPPVDAVMCVQIIRACGLLAAVNEASIWLGGGTIPSAP